MARIHASAALAAVAALGSATVHAFPTGITGRSGNPAASAGGGDTCDGCHSGGTYNYNTGTITGSTSLATSTLATYTLNFTKSAGTTAARAGFNLSATGGTLGDPNTGAASVQKVGAELTHSSPASPDGAGAFSWNFTWTSPSTAGTYKFYFCNNPVNNNGSSTGDGAIRCGSVDITVEPPPPAAPVANDDAYGVEENGSRTVAAPGVLANDTDVNGDALTAVLGTGPVNGDLVFNPDGSFSYTPDTDFIGTDTFTYVANDGDSGDANEAPVTLTVAPNTAPVATTDSYTATRNAQRVVAAPGVLANDTDAEGDDLTVAVVADPANGTVTLNPDGGFTYTPAADFTGTDTFTYQASDGIDNSNVATVTITVAAPSSGGGGGGGGGAPSPLMLALLALAALWRQGIAALRRSPT
jgi:hypothetical protein